MKYNYLLLGPQASGKTTLATAMSREIVGEYLQTSGEGKLYRFNIKEKFNIKEGNTEPIITPPGGQTLFEIGGEGTRERKVKDTIKNTKKILFIFDGNSFLDEIKNPAKEGMINAMIRRDFWNSIEKDKEQQQAVPAVFFIANFKSDVPQNEEKCKEMRTEILKYITNANNEYEEICHSKRYPYYDLFGDCSHFFCAYLKDKKQVDSIFRIIKTTNK